ncbi:hypothetical protein SUNI508_04189 [Seiridium unicorne]|uniref:Rhodopsin domain-containing protein n=1 Tax=Seiridium unicorne TaxID=138068 RepID=A0ABR2V8P7_9PEZI
MKTLFAVMIIIPLGSIFPKAAILVLYLQFFSVKKWVRPAVYVGLVFNFLTYAPLVASAIYYTTPRGGTTWAELALSTTPQRGLYMTTVKAAMSVLLNLYILVIPLPILYRLHLAVSKRLQLIAVFATASAGVVASIVDLVYCVELLDFEDSTWREACVSITTIVENNVAIIVGSMPAFATFLKVHVAQSTSVQALLSRFSKKKQDTSGFQSDQQTPLRTFGSSEPKGHPYYALTESALLKSQCSTSGETMPTLKSPDKAILRTSGIPQQTDTTHQKSQV